MPSNIAFSSVRRWPLLLAAASIAALPPLFTSIQPTSAAAGLQMTIISSRSELVTGGDALVRIDRSPGDTASIHVTLNGKDVTSAFIPDRESTSVLGLIKGLALGKNILMAASAGAAGATATLVNYPPTGPVISGPHEQPFICDSERFKLVGGGTLGRALDDDCSVATRVDYAYRSTSGER